MGKRIALVIGTCTYEDPQFAALACPVHDVKGLAATLRDPGVGGFDEVHELVDRSSRDLQLEISNVFADRERDDLVVVYISGHGYKDRGKLYFVCKDTKRNRLNATGVPSDFLKQEMEASSARRQVLILDCCHSGAFSAGMKSGAAGVGAQAGAIQDLGGDESGKIVLTASDSIQYAYEGDAVTGEAQHSVFTKHLLEGLRTGAADMDGDGTISVDELFDYVRQKVREERPEQRPQRSAAGESGDVFIARSPYVKPAELSKELVEATRSKDRFVVMGAIDELWQLLEDPDPRMAAAARQRLQEMLTEDHFRSVLDKVQEALDAVKVNVTVKQKAPKVRTGPAGPGSAGFEEPAEQEPSGPWLRQGTGPGLVDVVLVRGGERRTELARAIGEATGAGLSDAHAFINDAPHATFPRLNQADARRLVGELERCGATVEVRPVRSRTPGGGGSGGEPESSVWSVPRTPGNRQGGGGGAREPVRVHVQGGGGVGGGGGSPGAGRASHQRVGGARDAGLGSVMAATGIAGGGMSVWAMIASGVCESAMEGVRLNTEYGAAEFWKLGQVSQETMNAGVEANATLMGAVAVALVLWVVFAGVSMAAGLPMGWTTKASWLKRMAVGAAWAVFAPLGVGISAWVSRDQPGMTTTKAWVIGGIWGAAFVAYVILFGAYDSVMNYSVPRWPVAGLLAAACWAGGTLAHWYVLSSARKGAVG